MKYTIKKQFHFSASHQLSGLPDGHQCGRLHGHNYMVEIVLRAEKLSPVGFVIDYGELTFFKEWIDQTFDHRHLNDVVSFNPTAELLAAYLYAEAKTRWPETCMIRVSETPATWAQYGE